MYSRHPILYEDDHIIAVDKPEGVLSHPNEGAGRQSAAFEGRFIFAEKKFLLPKGGNLWLVHRIDQDTSGVLLAAKSEEIANKFYTLFEHHRIEKIYLAGVAGRAFPPKGVWKDHLKKRNPGGGVRSSVNIHLPPNAELSYQLEHVARLYFPATIRAADRKVNVMEVSQLRIKLVTGKTHQIRVQAARRGYPVLGDEIYGNFSLNKALRKNIGLKRLFLHACSLSFLHPVSHERLTIRAGTPETLKTAIDELHKHPSRS
jgi:23S rRNA-/tRNA-specific pseudouridylate synthase